MVMKLNRYKKGRRFTKGMRKVGNVQSTATLKAKKLLRRLEKEEKSGAKEIKNTQEDVECDGKHSWSIGDSDWEEKEEKNYKPRVY